MKIDSHQHFWKYNPQRDAWIDESMKVIQADFSPPDLESHLRQHKIDGCIAVQADQSEEETEFLLELASQYSFVKGVVGWVDLRAANVEERLEYYSQNSYFKGVRHIVQAEKEDFLLSADFQKGISTLSQFKLPYDILIFPNQLESAIQTVNQFPNQEFVLDHIAKPYIKNQSLHPWKSLIQELAKASNVSCKISGLITEADLKNWEARQIEPYLDVVFNAFGEDRVLFGSDWPVCLLAGSYDEVVGLVSNYTADFSSKAKNKLFGANAARIYNITV
jgi:L-fuconolactonase